MNVPHATEARTHHFLWELLRAPELSDSPVLGELTLSAIQNSPALIKLNKIESALQ
jgi:hypothetical protein